MSVIDFETELTSTPVCPHCGYAMTYDNMAGVASDGVDLYSLPTDEAEGILECINCFKKFLVSGSYKPQYTTGFLPDDYEDDEAVDEED